LRGRPAAASRAVNLDDAQRLLDEAKSEAAKAADAAARLDDLTDLDRRYIGRRSPAAVVTEAIKNLPASDRRAAGQAVAAYKAAVREVLEGRRDGIVSAEGEAREGARLDLSMGSHGRTRGHLHLVTQVQRELEDIFAGLGYRVAEGPEVEDDWHNFEALNIPPAHPARSMQDTLYVRLGAEEQVMLRTHTSPVQIRAMERSDPPTSVIGRGRTSRE